MVLDRQHGMFFLKGYLRKAKGITEVETAVSRCILHFQDVRNRQGMSGKTDFFQISGICFVRAVKNLVDFFLCSSFCLSTEYRFINPGRRRLITGFLKAGKRQKHQPILIQFRDDLVNRNSHKDPP